MFRFGIYSSLLFLTFQLLPAQTASSDLPTPQAMLAEIRQLRSDLQTAAATIQRVNIVMFRIQTEASTVERLTQKLEQVRSRCDQAQANQKMFASQIEDAQADKGAQDPALQNRFERNLANLKSALAELSLEVPRCQAEQADTDSHLRTAQNRVIDLQDQLEKLDKVLGLYAVK